ncbi:MAG: VOC family protein [Pigmentiphaga sp.]
MSESTTSLRRSVANPGGLSQVQGLHHFAYRCRDAEETRVFYEDLLGLPLVATVFHDRVPSTGESCPYCHIFFELGDGSYVAFFDLFNGESCAPDPATPAWVNHLALEAGSREFLNATKERLEQAGVEVLGIVDHKWFDSIYFFDPNGIRLELVYRTAPLREMEKKARNAHALLREGLAKRRTQ